MSQDDAREDRPEFVGRTLCFGDVDDVLLICHGEMAPDPYEWQFLLQRIAITDYRVIAVSTRGGEPLPVQRNALLRTFAECERRPPRVAVLSDSPRMRWAYAAMCFVSALDARTLRFEAVGEAVRFLECAPPAARLDLARRHAHRLLEGRAATRPSVVAS
jgi:hypothetical protein